MIDRIVVNAALVLALALFGIRAQAHGLALEAHIGPDAITGTATYAGHGPAGGIRVELAAAGSGPERPLASGQTDTDGRFRFARPDGEVFVLTAYGEEDHHARIELSTQHGTQVDTEQHAHGHADGPGGIAPGYWITAAVLLATLLLWLFGKRQDPG